MRVALVHDYLTHFGGAERVLTALMGLFPHAPVYTLVYDPGWVESRVDKRRLRTSFLQRWPAARRAHRYAPLALMPLAIEQFDLSEYDVVFSATHSFGKGIVLGPKTLHISYCFTPTRYAWDDSHRYAREFSPGVLWRGVAPLALSYLRMWDYYAAQRVNTYVTLSQYVAQRIKKYYGRVATVIPPPVKIEAFRPRHQHDGYYLVVSRLVPYKRTELAIEACERLGRPLKVVGTGPEEKWLKRRADKWTEFLGFVSDDDLPDLYGGARALLFPQEEDFGITPLEAAASGKPTIAYRAGGSLETVVDQVTGEFFREQTADSLMAAILRGEQKEWDVNTIRQHAWGFRQEEFTRGIAEVVEREWAIFKGV